MEVTLNRLKYLNEECSAYNRESPISSAQLRTICLIEKYVEDQFCGSNMGVAWDFIAKYAGRTIVDRNGNEIEILNGMKRHYKLIDWDVFYSDNLIEIEENTLDFQEDYFNKRHEALLKGEFWEDDDRLNDGLDEFLDLIKLDINYDVSKDGELLE